mgnify:CR=1 FL=1
MIFWYRDRSPSAMMQKKSQGTHPVDRMLTYPAKPVFRIKRRSQKTISKKNITNQDIILSRKRICSPGRKIYDPNRFCKNTYPYFEKARLPVAVQAVEYIPSYLRRNHSNSLPEKTKELYKNANPEDIIRRFSELL